MARAAAEYALGRALAWLRWSGVPLDLGTTSTALRLVEEAVVDGDVDLIRRVMEALPQRIALPDLCLPPASPPIRRISLGYAPYL